MAKFYLDDIKNIKFYNTPFCLPVGEDDSKKGAATVILTPNIESSISLLRTNKYFVTTYYSRYYIDRSYSIKVGKKAIIDKKKENERKKYIYNRIRGDIDFIKITPSTLVAGKDFNMVIDMYYWNKLILENMKSGLMPAISSNRYFEYIMPEINRLTSRKSNKLIIIPFSDWRLANVVVDDESNSNKKYNPVSFILYLLKYDFPKLKDIFKDYNIVFTGNAGYFKFNVSEIETNNGKELLSNFARAIKRCDGEKNEMVGTEEPEVPKSSLKATVAHVVKRVEDVISPETNPNKSFTGESKDMEEINKEVVKAISTTDLESEDDIDKALDNNDELLTKVEEIKLANLTGAKSIASMKRDTDLRNKMMNVKLKNKTLKELLAEAADNELSTTEIDADVINEDLKQMQSINFDKDYNNKEWEKDLARVLESFSHMSIPMYVKDFSIEDTSDEFNLKQTVNIKFEDSNRVRHTVKVDLPQLYHNSYFFINGGKKNLIKQITLNPISKVSPDTVQVATNYNKITLTRAGLIVSPKLNRLNKVLNSIKTPNIKITSGNNTISNNLFKTSIEYDTLAEKYMSISVPKSNLYIGFNQTKLREYLDEKFGKQIKSLPDNQIPIGYINDKLIKLDVDKDLIISIPDIIDENISLSDLLSDKLSKASNAFESKLSTTTPGKRFVYTRATLMKRDVPLVLLLAYSEGFTPLLHKIGVKYEVSDTKPRLSNDEKVNKGIIEFNDKYLIYEKYPYEHSLIMNGVSILPTKEYNLEDFNNKDVYTEIFELLFGRRDIANSFDNFYDCMIDGLTKVTLEKLNYPTNYTDVLLYANGLLADNSYIPEKNLSGSRLRGNELIMAHLYKSISNAYGRYKISSSRRNPEKVSLPQDIVLKELMISPNVEEYSTLNPVLEVEKMLAVGYKGLSGLNLDRAFTIQKRSYDKSMVGNLALSTPQSAKVGVIRQLTVNSGLKSTRGFFNVTDPKDFDKLKAAQLMSPAELLTPMTFNHADTPRVSMNSTQAKHTVPVKDTDRALVGNGFDKVLHGILSDDFVFKAKCNGKVESIDEDLGIMILKYKDGSKDVVKISSEVAKNSNGGFFISNKLDPVIAVGKSFSKGDVVAQNSNYFSKDEFGGTTYNTGTLAKIAIAGGYATFEDSTIVTNKLSKKMSTSVVMKKDITLGINSNIDFMVGKGDKVEVGDPLLIFEDSYDESEYNALLSKIGDELSEDINKFGKVPITSKYSGVIEDIKIYHTVETSEMSPTLKKIVEKYNKNLNKVKKVIDSTIPERIDKKVMFEPNHKVVPYKGKIKGTKIDEGVIIEFYIKYEDHLSIGDKITFYTALKGIVGEVIDDDKAPYSEFRKDEQVDAFLGPISIAKRMTDDIKFIMLTNKVLIEAKRKCKEIWEEK